MKLSVLYLSGALAGLSIASPFANLTSQAKKGPVNVGYGGIGSVDEGHTPSMPPALTTNEFFKYKHAANEYLRLNNWIMDNRSGYRPEKEGRKRVVQGNYFRSSVLADADLSTAIYEATHSMVYMIRNQTFENGNHRTAILLLLDYLNSIGAPYGADPLALYLQLADPLRLFKSEVQPFIDQLAMAIEEHVITPPANETTDAPADEITDAPADEPADLPVDDIIDDIIDDNALNARSEANMTASFSEDFTTKPPTSERKSKKKEKKPKKPKTKKPKKPKKPTLPLSPNDTSFRKAYALRVKFANKYWFAKEDNEARVKNAQLDYDENKARVGIDRTAQDIVPLYERLEAAKKNQKEEAIYWQVEPKGGWVNFKGGLWDQTGLEGER